MNQDLERKYVTFVCTGNTCRSPMAEKLFLHAIAAESSPINQLKAISAGISAYPGDPASPNAIKVMRDCGLNLDNHRSQLLSQEILNESLFIFCMTQTHKNTILEEFDINEHPIFLLRDFIPVNSKNIPDPFGQNVAAYKNCRDNIVETIPSIINFIKKTLSKK